MILNPIVAMLHDTTADRWHPLLFRESPLPGGEHTLVRHKSKGHHTVGFATHEEAIAECHSMAEELKAHAIGNVRTSLAKAFPWDGEGVPAMVVFFKDIDGQTVPVLG
jgi:hypothetical protein